MTCLFILSDKFKVHREEMLIFMEYCPEGTLEELVTTTESGLEESTVRR